MSLNLTYIQTLAMTASISGGLAFTGMAVEQWVKEPLVWRITNDVVDHKDIPEPAITICVHQVLEKFSLSWTGAVKWLNPDKLLS